MWERWDAGVDKVREWGLAHMVETQHYRLAQCDLSAKAVELWSKGLGRTAGEWQRAAGKVVEVFWGEGETGGQHLTRFPPWGISISVTCSTSSCFKSGLHGPRRKVLLNKAKGERGATPAFPTNFWSGFNTSFLRLSAVSGESFSPEISLNYPGWAAVMEYSKYFVHLTSWKHPGRRYKVSELSLSPLYWNLMPFKKKHDRGENKFFTRSF